MALLAAHWAPTTGYEISLYGATPLTVWIPLGVALVASAYAAVTARSTWAWAGGVVGAGGAALTVCALPIIRGYYFYGTADALTHLGWVKDIVFGVLDPAQMLYPGMHVYSIFISRVTDLPFHRSMLFAVLSFVVMSAVFVPLTVWILTQRRWLVTAGVFAGLCYLSINQVSTHYMSTHPFSQSTQMFPLALYTMALYLVSRRDDAAVGERRLTAIGGAFALFLIGAVFYHPEHAVNLLVVLGFAVVIQIGGRWVLQPDHRLLTQRSLLPHTVGFALLAGGWTILHSRGDRTLNVVLSEVRDFLFGGGSSVGGVVQQRGGALSAIGVSYFDVFLRMFLVMGVFAALSGILILAAGVGRVRAGRSDTGAVVTHLALGLAVLVPASLALFVGNVSKLFFRNLGSIMMVSTIVGVLALGYLPILLRGSVRGRSIVRRLRDLGPTASSIRTALAVVVVVALMTHSLAIMFKDPYIYRPNRQVTEQAMGGYESFFEHQVEGVDDVRLRATDRRYLHAIYGVEEGSQGTGLSGDWESVPNDTLVQLPSKYNESRYLAFTEFDRLRELIAYQQVRYDESDFAALDRQVGVSRVHDSGEVRGYLINGSGNESATG
ncbi:hypothetical protein K933_16582 [Candidatus Halobonum tyrrellensis G22]|uniref:Uncharacterized protein n=1 Tax=Candidatus Halobonum tyrrellensis G22 TaxID=1324957 RepID=V4GND5_9EURY|nr:hypothetical protein K933_16582 [Candidatus Halobonum tyrrellensis G22]